MKYFLLFSFIGVTLILSCEKKNFEVETVGGNSNPPLNYKPPTANAGPDQSIQLPATWVTLDGSKSADSINKPITYKWKKLAGPDYIHYYASFYQSPQPAQIEMELYGPGDYIFELTVFNSVGLSATDIVKITVANGPTTAHPIDMVFSVNSFCGISGNFPSTVYYSEAYFTLVAASVSSFSGSTSTPDVRIEQAYEKYAQDYFSPPLLTLTDRSSGLINFQFSSNVNFFKLPYNNGPADFADSIYVTSGRGQFANARAGTPLICTGTANTTNHSGSVRLQGTLYY